MANLLSAKGLPRVTLGKTLTTKNFLVNSSLPRARNGSRQSENASSLKRTTQSNRKKD
jgi:hypothetical protein